jgi:cytochrome oxidase Cu insertion factor (SCO1/SenC/PrrC family)
MNDSTEPNDNTPLAPPPPGYEAPSAGSMLPYFLALAVLFVMAYGAFTWWRVSRWELTRGEAMPINAIGPPLTEFELTERSGKPFRSADMRGKVWVVTYFFCTCPGSCVWLNKNIQLLNDVPALEEVTWVSITCDPDNDTLEELRKYADNYQADPERWLFCRAPLDYIKRVGLGMNLDVYRQGHKDYAVVIDKAGKIRGMYNAGSRNECRKLQERLVELLAETPPSDMAAAPSEGTAR